MYTFSKKSSEKLSKMSVSLPSNEWHGYDSEGMWVKPLGCERYQIENSPFFAYGISYLDIVFARMLESKLVMVETVQYSGHSTYRILLKGNPVTKKFSEFWSPLELEGCTFERASLGYELLSIDVPPSADIHTVYKLLQKGESADVWDFDEGYCAHSV